MEADLLDLASDFDLSSCMLTDLDRVILPLGFYSSSSSSSGLLDFPFLALGFAKLDFLVVFFPALILSTSSLMI